MRRILASLCLLLTATNALGASTLVGSTYNIPAWQRGSDYFFQLSDANITAALFLAEKNAEFKFYRTGLTLKNITANVTANTLSSSSTGKSRVNGAAGTQSFTIGALGTGFFTDATNSDVLANPSRVDFNLTTGAASSGETIEVSSVTAELATTSGKTTCVLGSAYNLYDQAAGLTRYAPVVGQLGAAGVANEAGNNVTYRVRSGGFAYAVQGTVYQAITATTDVTLMVNGVATALTANLASGATTSFYDATNAVHLSPGDLIDFKVVTGAGSGTLRLTSLGIYIESDSNLCDIGSGGAYVMSGAGARTEYASILGTLDSMSTTETALKLKIPFATRIGRLRYENSAAVSGGNTGTYVVRVNGADTTLDLTSASGTAAGWHETDCDDSIAVAAGDLVDIKLSSAGTYNTTIAAFGLTLNYDAAVDCGGGVMGLVVE